MDPRPDNYDICVVDVGDCMGMGGHFDLVVDPQ